MFRLWAFMAGRVWGRSATTAATDHRSARRNRRRFLQPAATTGNPAFGTARSATPSNVVMRTAASTATGRATALTRNLNRRPSRRRSTGPSPCTPTTAAGVLTVARRTRGCIARSGRHVGTMGCAVTAASERAAGATGVHRAPRTIVSGRSRGVIGCREAERRQVKRDTSQGTPDGKCAGRVTSARWGFLCKQTGS